ncbi:MAG: BtrH N-terminal domain-containing protein [Nocardioides sp.]
MEGGRPVRLWADIAELPYLRVKLSMSRHDIVVIGCAHQPPNYPFPPMHFGVP